MSRGVNFKFCFKKSRATKIVSLPVGVCCVRVFAKSLRTRYHFFTLSAINQNQMDLSTFFVPILLGNHLL